MITRIQVLPEDVGANGAVLADLSKVNVLIGQNNAGKSRLLRGALKGAARGQTAIAVSPIDDRSLKPIRDKFMTLGGDFNIINKPLDSGRAFREISRRVESLAGANTNRLPKDTKEEWFGIIEQIAPENFFYIPVLRGLRALNPGVPHTASAREKDGFVLRTTTDYFGDLNRSPVPGLEIFSGQTMYDEVRKRLLGSKADRESIAKYEKFLSQAFFEGQSVTLVPRDGHDVLNFTIGEMTDIAVYDLGDGMQSLIIFTFWPFLRKSGAYFIEEVDMFLHPGLQRRLIEVLNSPEFVGSSQFYMTTHSNHLVDVVRDIGGSIYHVQKTHPYKNEGIKVTSDKDQEALRRIVNDLGARASSLTLANATIWVEGISDRLYLSHALELYRAEHPEFTYLQDIHYSFVEYGGANITHLDLLAENEGFSSKALTTNLLLIADGDDRYPKGKKKERYQQLTQKLRDRFIRLDRKEMENLMTPEQLGKAIDGTPLNAKYSSYAWLHIGNFLREQRPNAAGFLKTSGNNKVLADKAAFARRINSATTSWTQLGSDLQTLVAKLLDFIEAANMVDI